MRMLNFWKRKREDGKENYIMRNFLVCNVYLKLLDRLFRRR